jgi:hypothetical protein
MATCQATFALHVGLAGQRLECTLVFAVLLNKFIFHKNCFFFVIRIGHFEKELCGLFN